MSVYTATVTDELFVIVEIDGIEVDRPGPWADSDAAHAWAAAIVSALENGAVTYGS